ncbi:ribonuclease H-like domain-containing protein [Mycena rosella]|uniref:Ribonuclease H-like domain-containing protein n=1 Tax=Mycena rosella TaxID=1033263 RepID=A0AAD7D3Z4_MYCRO|nr:ribonuclease H-like domain-containing protein [Mycena rosella]
MSKAPLCLVSRCRAAPSSPPRRAPMSSASTTDKPQSRALAALASMSVPELAETHPFFRPATAPPIEPRGAHAPPLKATRSLPPATKRSLVRVSHPTLTEQTAALDLAPRTRADAPAKLPVYSYKSLSPVPKMRFTRSEAEADKWVQELDLTGPISMDLEWVVVYRKGATRPVSLVQVADKKNIIVIQLRTKTGAMGRFPLNLQRLLENPDIPKMGANILNDAKKLFKDYGVLMRNVVELGALAKQADPPCTDATVFGTSKRIVSLAKLVERYLHKTLCKEDDVRKSDWEDPELEQKAERLEYASNDVYCGLQVYDHLMALAEANALTLVPAKYTGEVHHERLAARPSPPPPLSTSTPPADPTALPPVPMIYYTDDMQHTGVTSQALRAYRYWLAQRDIDNMCKELCVKAVEGETLKRATVITYVVSAIKCWPAFAKDADLGALRLLIQTDLKSWERHYEWLASVAVIDPKSK